MYAAGIIVLTIFYFKTSSTNIFPTYKHEMYSTLLDTEKGQTKTFQSTDDKMRIQYQGRVFLVDRENPAYNREQLDAIDSIITNVKPGVVFGNYKSLMKFYRQLRAPASGGSTGGFGTQTNLGQFTWISVQIPAKNRFRTFIYYRNSEQDPYKLFDDFYYTGHYAPLLNIVVERREVSYFNQNNGNLVRAREF